MSTEIQRLKWIDRQFATDIPPGQLDFILERLRGTPVRLKQMLRGLDEEMAGLRINEKWSIKDHVGHLTDLEKLHEGRIDDYLNNESMLRAADMSNKVTENAKHRTKKLQSLFNKFNKTRSKFINRLESLEADTMLFQSLHPRLQIMMRPVDMAFFVAEHDDHHLAIIRDLIKG